MTGDRRPQLFSSKCTTCVFWPGNRMRLHEGRLADLIKQNRERGTALICHKTLPYGDHPELGETVCRGYYDAYGKEVRVIQIVERLGGFCEIPPPP